MRVIFLNSGTFKNWKNNEFQIHKLHVVNFESILSKVLNTWIPIFDVPRCFIETRETWVSISKQCQINIFNKQWTFSFSLYLISPYNVLSIPPYIYMYMYLPRLTFTVICTSKLPCIWVLWWAWSQICNQGESNSGNAGVFPMSIPPMVHSESCP